MNEHDRYAELAVGHALNALEPEDEVTFLAHLPGCAACAEAVAEHRETLGHLSYAVASAEPPPTLLEGIRAGVEASGRAGAFPPPVSLTERRSRTVTLRTALLSAAASIVLVVALALANLSLSSRNSDLRDQNSAFQRTVSGLLAKGAQRVELTGAGDAVAIVHGDQVDLVLDGVAPNDRQHSTYVLWQADTQGVSAAGVFDVPSTGLTVVSSGLRVSTDGLKQLMITKEAGRVAPPTARTRVLFSGTA